MNYGNIKSYDIADGTGVRVSLFVSGCRHHCKGCFNAPTWDFNYGKPFTRETQDKLLELLAPSELKGEVFQFLNKLSVYQNVDAGKHPVCKRSVDLTSGNHIFVKKISTVTPDGFIRKGTPDLFLKLCQNRLVLWLEWLAAE